MCFSYSINLSSEQLQSKFNFSELIIPTPAFYFSGFDHPTLPIINQHLEVVNAQWGLIPNWCKESEKQLKLRDLGLNARAETASEKPMFKTAWQNNPIVIIASGFFEWQTKGNKKIPYYIYPKENKILYFAGIADHFIDSESGYNICSFSILTTQANDLLSKIHNTKKRMPVVLLENEIEDWLTSNESLRNNWCKPAPENYLTAHTVDSRINKSSVHKNEPWAIESVQYHDKQMELF